MRPTEIADPAIAPISIIDDAPDEVASVGLNSFVDDLGVVIPPQVATALVSPLLVLEALVGAVADSGKAMLGPGAVFLLGALWIANESRIIELVGGRRAREEGVS